MSSQQSSSHVWKFFRAGGFDQVRLDSGADLAALAALDQKLWVALACPTRGLEFDAATLDLVDTDKDQRIRVPEILAAVKWATERLRNPEDLITGAGKPALPLSAIQEGTPAGAALLASAQEILLNLGKPNAGEVSFEDLADTAKIFANTKFNGDGVLPADSADDPAHQQVIAEIIDCLGGETDRSTQLGVTQAKVDQFFADAQAFADWWAKSDAEKASILPLGAATPAAAAALGALRVKVDDFFARCRLAAFDPRAAAALNRDEKEYIELSQKELALGTPELAPFPLAHIEAGRSLPLVAGLNPAWAEAVAKLRTDTLTPLIGDKVTLTEAEWSVIKERLAAHGAWLAGKGGASVEKLGLPRVCEILALNCKPALDALVAQDKALEPQANAIADVDRLVRYHRDLHTLLKNFVSFSDFYGRTQKAIFQFGTLYIDGKGLDLVLPVEDVGRHVAMAGLAGTYLLYCDCVRKATGEKHSIVAAVSAGDTGDLMVGRNGVFYDRKGRDFDATVTKIIENPISIRQAFWSPYKKFVRMIEELVAKRAAAADAASTSKLSAAAGAVTTVDAAKPPAPPAGPKKMDIGVVAAIGVAVGAIGTAISVFATGMMQMTGWQIPLLFVGLMLLISTPSMLLAFLKLRRRNLGPILDANGWAVNARARMNIPFGTTLTALAKLPPNSERSLVDPYAEKKSKWPTILVIAVVLFIVYKVLDNKGKIHEWTKGWIGTPAGVAEIRALEKALKK